MARNAEISLLGHPWILSPNGVAYWKEKELAVVSDLHLSKGASLASTGQFLPPYDSEKTLLTLQQALSPFSVKSLILLGDSFHDAMGENYLTENSLNILSTLQQEHDLIWIKGNHDAQAHILGEATLSEYRHPPFLFRHEPSPPHNVKKGIYEISGHLHPKHTLTIQGRRIRRPCYLQSENQLIMPAFGSYTGGMDAELSFSGEKWIHHVLTGRQVISR